MRTILAAIALATATVIGGAVTATADDDPFDVPDVPSQVCALADCGNF
jgi:hypothetical protein